MTYLFNLILVRPLLNLLVLGYQYIPGHNVGWAIVLLTILVRIILAPSMFKALKNQRDLMIIQPKMNAIREKHKEDKEAQAKALMELYKEHNYNPLSSCLPTLIQLPILLALYRVFIIGLGTQSLQQYLYTWVRNPGSMSPYFIFGMNLTHVSLTLGILAGILQYFQSRMMIQGTQRSTDPMQSAMQSQMMYVLPAVTILISLRIPAGLPLYWITTTLFAIAQQFYIMKDQSKTEIVVKPIK